MAEAAWLTGRYEDSLRLRERAFAKYSAREETASAAMMAIRLVYELYPRGELAVASGWQKTAERSVTSKGIVEPVEIGRIDWA